MAARPEGPRKAEEVGEPRTPVSERSHQKEHALRDDHRGPITSGRNDEGGNAHDTKGYQP